MMKTKTYNDNYNDNTEDDSDNYIGITGERYLPCIVNLLLFQKEKEYFSPSAEMVMPMKMAMTMSMIMTMTITTTSDDYDNDSCIVGKR